MRHKDPRYPFKAAACGLSPAVARRRYQRLFDGVYVGKSTKITARLKAEAAWAWAEGNCVLSGVSAAAVFNVKWLPEDAPPEIVTPRVVRVKGLVAHRDKLLPQDIVEVCRMRVTTPPRTAFDLARRQPLAQAVALIDALYQATSLTPDLLRQWSEQRPRWRGVDRLRRAIELSDAGAESPRETALRLLVLSAGLSRPVTQFVVRDHNGRFLGRADLAWPEWRVALEYEGAHHFTDPVQARKDATRANAFMQAGWRVLRVTRELARDEGELLRLILSALRAAGAPV